MPKIEVDTQSFYTYLGRTIPLAELEDLLPAAKAELDGIEEDKGILKIELNDTNRPDLWSTAGLSRQLRIYSEGKKPEYGFFSRDGSSQEYGDRRVIVDPELKDIRPFIVAFAIEGKPMDDAGLRDLIQTQEKLCWNFGQKRKAVAMGVYRSDYIQYPVRYTAADPKGTKFVPLGYQRELSLESILREHPKGKEYGYIVENFEKFPYITDNNGDVLSFPPIINSARIGAVEEGDTNLFIEMTGCDLPTLSLAASIVACDLADAGYTILPVAVEYPFDTPFGKTVVFPYYFQEPVHAELTQINKMLGTEFSLDEAASFAAKMGLQASTEGDTIYVRPPEYRNDFLHPVDLIEDIMIGRGMKNFEPVMPEDFTVGRLSRESLFARKVKDIMVGLGFQEMVYNYLGSRHDFLEKMRTPDAPVVQIANPMTENYEYVRPSILPNLMASESVSGNAVYPHHMFEIGKVAYPDNSDNYGSVTKNSLGFLSADKTAGFNMVSSHVSAVFFYLSKEYTLEELRDGRFIEGRCARIFYNGRAVGVFGEVHPEVLENWGIQMPATLCEIDLDDILQN